MRAAKEFYHPNMPTDEEDAKTCTPPSSPAKLPQRAVIAKRVSRRLDMSNNQQMPTPIPKLAGPTRLALTSPRAGATATRPDVEPSPKRFRSADYGVGTGWNPGAFSRLVTDLPQGSVSNTELPQQGQTSRELLATNQERPRGAQQRLVPSCPPHVTGNWSLSPPVQSPSRVQKSVTFEPRMYDGQLSGARNSKADAHPGSQLTWWPSGSEGTQTCDPGARDSLDEDLPGSGQLPRQQSPGRASGGPSSVTGQPLVQGAMGREGAQNSATEACRGAAGAVPSEFPIPSMSTSGSTNDATAGRNAMGGEANTGGAFFVTLLNEEGLSGAPLLQEKISLPPLPEAYQSLPLVQEEGARDAHSSSTGLPRQTVQRGCHDPLRDAEDGGARSAEVASETPYGAETSAEAPMCDIPYDAGQLPEATSREEPYDASWDDIAAGLAGAGATGVRFADLPQQGNVTEEVFGGSNRSVQDGSWRVRQGGPGNERRWGGLGDSAPGSPDVSGWARGGDQDDEPEPHWPPSHAWTAISAEYDYRTITFQFTDPRLPGVLRPIIQV